MESSKVSRLHLATERDGPELRSFYEKFTLKGPLEFRPHRPQSFFDPYLIHSNDHDTYLFRSPEGDIQALTSFIYRKTWVDGQIAKIAFATDLRVINQRRPLLEWSQHFLPVIDDIFKRKGVKAIFSTINKSDPLLNNVFLKPRSPRRAWPRYHLYRNFNLVSLHGRFPWCPKPIPGIQVQRSKPDEFAELSNFLIENLKKHPFASVWDKPSLESYLARFPGLRASDFWIARNSKLEIIGASGAWSPMAIQQYRPLSYSLRAHNFRQFLKFGKLFGWTRPLTKPLKSTGLEAPLQFRYLLLPVATHEDIFEALVSTIFDSLPGNEFLMYANLEEDYRKRPPRGWVAAEIPYSLYSLVPPNAAMPAHLDPSLRSLPELEAYYFL